MNIPLLSIAIPTYNRCHELQLCLEALYSQIQNNKEIELIVTDNASTDGTEDFMFQFIKNHSGIRYYRNERNLGFDGNFFKCFQYANGKYIYILGDDDYLLPGAIDGIMQGLKKDPIALFINMDKIGENADKRSMRYKMIPNENYVICDKDIVLKEIGIYITFISSLIMRNDYIKEFKELSDYSGSYFIFAYGLFYTMKREGIYIINTYDCLKTTPNKTVSYDLYCVWFENYHKLLIEGGKLGGISHKITKEIFRQSLTTTLFEYICYFRQTCKNEKEWNKEYVKNNIKDFPGVRLIYKGALQCPHSWLSLYYILGHCYFKFLYKRWYFTREAGMS